MSRPFLIGDNLRGRPVPLPTPAEQAAAAKAAAAEHAEQARAAAAKAAYAKKCFDEIAARMKYGGGGPTPPMLL